MHSRLSRLLGAEYPVMAFSHCRDVVAAVSRGGGFGVLGAGSFTPEELDTDLRWLREHTKGATWGIDLLIPSKYQGAENGGLEPAAIPFALPKPHVQFVEEILARYDIPPLPPGADPLGRFDMSGVSPRGYEPLLEIALRHEVKLIASALGPPPEAVVEKAHSAGALVAALAGKVSHAERHRDVGVDLIVAQGSEAGGHTGEISTIVLIPDVVDAVRPLPVVAAGGIATGRQMAAAMALGADGVWCGSIWLVTDEAETEPIVKEKLLLAGAGETVRSRSLTGKPARMLRTAWTEEWEGEGAPAPLPVPLQSALIAEAQARINSAARARPGAAELSTYFVGQVVGRLRESKPARRVLHELVEEYVETLDRLAALTEELSR